MPCFSRLYTSRASLCAVAVIAFGAPTRAFSRRRNAPRALWLRCSAWAASRSALGAFFRRLKGRLGAPKAITATAHKLARLVYSLLKHGTAYVTQGMEEYERRYRERVVRSLSRRAKELGYALVELPAPAAAQPLPT